jgi:hypothetical protein
LRNGVNETLHEGEVLRLNFRDESSRGPEEILTEPGNAGSRLNDFGLRLLGKRHRRGGRLARARFNDALRHGSS